MEASSETGMRPKVKWCLGSWKGSGDSTHVVSLRHQRAFLSIEGASDPGLDWVDQKLERTQKRWPPSTEEHNIFVCQELASNTKRASERLEGAPELGGRPGI